MPLNKKKLGTFSGVFTPTALTILGVILYLRLGWVVGNAGIGGAILIIILAKLVTITTGLSITSIVTNERIGSGGSYAIISKSLGLELGGAIGLPLYLSQALGGALYITGFTEAWLSIFPDHNAKLVASLVLLFVFVSSFISVKFVTKIYYIVMTVIVLSLISFFAGKGQPGNAAIWGSFEKAPFWKVFAIFFPAVTGIEAGAAMSGDVKDPKKNLPIGILSAIFLTMGIYIAAAFWLGTNAPQEKLLSKYTIMLDIARWKEFVLAGIFGATLSSALGSIVGAPRTLMTLGRDKIIPFPRFFSKKVAGGEPRNALIFTVLLIEACLLLWDLNTIAPLLTMFFLITYGTINMAVTIEKLVKAPSFRPKFDVPLIFPVVGSVWSIVVMFLINPLFAGVAFALIIIFYIIQVRRGLVTPWGDVRVSMFNAIAEWAAKTAAKMPQHAKSWKPNLMIPVEDPANWRGIIEFVRDIIFPSGTLRVFSINVIEKGAENRARELLSHFVKKEKIEIPEKEIQETEQLKSDMTRLIDPLKKEGIFTSYAVIESRHFLEGFSIITRTLKSMFFPPNTVFMTMSSDRSKDERLKQMLAIAKRERLGICVLWLHPKLFFGEKKLINVWMRTKSPNKNLSLLVAIQLQRNWEGQIRIISVVQNDEEKLLTEKVFSKLMDYARMPANTKLIFFRGEFKKALTEIKEGDINIFGMPEKIDCNFMHLVTEKVDASCLFVMDSGQESVLV